MKKRLSQLMLLSLAGIFLLSACGTTAETQPTAIPVVTSQGNVTAEGRIVPKDSTTLSFSVSGKIDTVLVEQGQKASVGMVMVSLSGREPAVASISAAQLELNAAQQARDDLYNQLDFLASKAKQDLLGAQKAFIEAQKAYNDLDTDTIRKELDDKEIAVQDAKTALDDAKKEADKYLNLEADNQTRKNAEQAWEDAKQEYQQAVYERDLLQNQLDQAQAAMDAARLGVDYARITYNDYAQDRSNNDKLILAEARLTAAQDQLKAAEWAVKNYDLLAPYPGNVMEIKSLRKGQWITAGQPIIVFADTSTWYVETKDLNEMDVVDLSVGQTVKVAPDAFKDVALIGTVESISETYTEKSGDVLYTVRIKLEDTDPRLRWGMTVQVSFDK